MGLIMAALNAASGVLADQWKEYFICDSMDADVLMKKGEHRKGKRSVNTKGSENVISNGSVIVVNEGQCMIIVDQGAIVEVCAQPGAFTWDSSSEPSIFAGSLGSSIVASFNTWKKRVGFGGDTGTDQRVYYFNTKDIIGNKYGTANPIPYRVVDNNIGMDMDVSVRCFGEYSYRLSDPILFYKKLGGNVTGEFKRSSIDSQLKTELLTALQPAFAAISEQGIRYSALPGRTRELRDALDKELDETWGKLYGIELVSIGVSSVTIPPEDQEAIKRMQQSAVYGRDPRMGAGAYANAMSQGIVEAAKNPNGAAMGFMGMNMASMSGAQNMQSLYQMGAQQGAYPQQGYPMGQPGMQQAYGQQPMQQGMQGQGYGQQMPQGAYGGQQMQPQGQGMQQGMQGAPAQAQAGTWTCSCGNVNSGKFCSNCGQPMPVQVSPNWVCSCGTENTGKFCMNCGKPRPV